MIIRRYLLLCLLPCLFLDTPYLIYTHHRFYTPIFHTYTEQDFGGHSSLKMNYLHPNHVLLQDAWILKSPFWGLGLDLEKNALQGPSLRHWLGTTPTGQDTLSYALHALYINVCLSLLFTSLSYITGCFLGMLQAISNPRSQLGLQIYLEVSRSIPLVMIIVLCLKQSFLFFILLFIGTQWTQYGYLSRIQTLPLLKKNYMLDAKYQGISHRKILAHLSPLIQKGTSALIPHTFLNYFSILTSLHYFDISLFPKKPSLGKLIFYAQQYPDQPQLLLITLLIFFSVSILSLKFSHKH